MSQPLSEGDASSDPRQDAMRAVGLVVFYFGCNFLASLLITIAVSLWCVATNTEFTLLKPALEEMLPLGACLCAVAITAIASRYLLFGAARPGTRLTMPSADDLALSVTTGLALGMFFINIGGLMVSGDSETAFTPGLQKEAVSVSWFLFALLLAPVIEEFLFRGILYDGFSGFGTIVAFSISTLGFVLVHLPETLRFMPALLGISALSLASGWYRIKTGNLFNCIVMHLSYNLALASAVIFGLILT
ncbi:MAG: CPBP family intramembrane metalloprotease [Pseudomonadales bacterium]|nr:CPBP family intramembrane metalloprotease [Pseudomonadales bacterium]